jgi:hypothetical protein
MSNIEQATAFPSFLHQQSKQTKTLALIFALELQQEGAVQGFIFPAGARALPAGNPQISQEIFINPPFNSFLMEEILLHPNKCISLCCLFL